jgi:hypothetical protein
MFSASALHSLVKAVLKSSRANGFEDNDDGVRGR